MNDKSKKRIYNTVNSTDKLNESPSATIRDKGVVSTITMGGTKFDVLNPNVVVEIQKTFDNHEAEINRLNDKVKKCNTSIRSLINEVERLNSELRNLVNEIRTRF